MEDVISVNNSEGWHGKALTASGLSGLQLAQLVAALAGWRALLLDGIACGGTVGL